MKNTENMKNAGTTENTQATRAALADTTIPANWPYCFQSDCELHDTCVRYQAGTALDGTRTVGHAVFPTAPANGTCPHFKLLRTIRSAWGFARIFDNVRVADAPMLRRLAKEMLGGNGNYYSYQHGTRRLSPEQQLLVRQLFARFGYNDIEFEHYQTEIDI